MSLKVCLSSFVRVHGVDNAAVARCARAFSNCTLSTAAGSSSSIKSTATQRLFLTQSRSLFSKSTPRKKMTEMEATNAANPPKVVTSSQRAYEHGDDNAMCDHPGWSQAELNSVTKTTRAEKDWTDRSAHATIKAIRFNFDWMSGYMWGKLTPTKCINRIMFLESVAGIPGSIGGVLRHLASLRNMRRDRGWIDTLYDEAENERMHLLVATQMKQPSLFFRTAVFATQAVFYNFFFFMYVVHPRYCHRLVGYLEEQAVITYQHIIDEIDNGSLREWGVKPAPPLAIQYWKMNENATIRDMILQYRADEAHHRDVNHAFADLHAENKSEGTGRNPHQQGVTF